MHNKPLEGKGLANLVSPMTAVPLDNAGSILVAKDGHRYRIENGVVDLLDERLLDEASLAEINAFRDLPIENVCYFRQTLFNELFTALTPMIEQRDIPHVCVELGGGEGYFAQNFIAAWPNGTAYVVDLSMRHLQNASDLVYRIRADMRFPHLRPASIGLSVFWVSLHHLEFEDQRRAIEIAAQTLVPGGLMMIFEPNEKFLPRRAFYKMKLSKQVYFDEEEKALDPLVLGATAEAAGLRARFLTSVNPPYNLAFLRHFTAWPLFLSITEVLHRLFPGGMSHLAQSDWPTLAADRQSYPWTGSYFLAVFEKSQ